MREPRHLGARRVVQSRAQFRAARQRQRSCPQPAGPRRFLQLNEPRTPPPSSIPNPQPSTATVVACGSILAAAFAPRGSKRLPRENQRVSDQAYSRQLSHHTHPSQLLCRRPARETPTNAHIEEEYVDESALKEDDESPRDEEGYVIIIITI